MERYDKSKIKLPPSVYEKIERDVVNLYIELKLKSPICSKEIVRRLGLVLNYMSSIKDDDELNKIRYDKNENPRDGYSFYNPSLSTSVIWINDIDCDYEKREDFTIMHEIGHIRLGHKQESDLAKKMANYYAAYALVPSPLYWHFKCKNSKNIVKKFEVSEECAIICFERCEKWKKYSGKVKPYEQDLIDHIESTLTVKKGGGYYA